MRRSRLCLLIALTAMLIGSAARAGQYSEALSKCLLASTSPQDRTELARWIFASAAMYPGVSDIACLDDKQRTGIVRKAGELVERLLTVSCRNEFRESVKHEGPSAIEASFTQLGEVAMESLVSDPKVQKAIGELASVINGDKLKAALEGKEP